MLPLTGLPAAGSALLALGIGCCGLAFTGIAAVAAQLASAARTARGIALGVLGVAFVLRGVGDSAGASGPSWLSWASPLAWIQLARPFAAPDPWVLALPLAVGAAGTGLAFALAAHRDLGAGLLPDRPGRATASAVLRGPFGLAWRLQRGALAGWAAGYAFIFAICGAAAKGIGQLFGHQQRAGARVHPARRAGGHHQRVPGRPHAAGRPGRRRVRGLGDRCGCGPRKPARRPSRCWPPRPAGSAGRSATSPSPSAGAALLLAVAGVAAGLGYGLRTGSAGTWVARMTGAALGQLPSALVLAAVAIALFGLLPRASVAGAWTALGLVVVISLFGQALQLSHWILDVSPFTHAPRLPGGPVPAAPLLWLCAVALALSAAGLAGLRRRDIG